MLKTHLSDTGTEAHTKVQVLRPIRIRSMLTYEKDTERFNIQGILREVIKTEFVIRNMPGKQQQEQWQILINEIECRLSGMVGSGIVSL